MNKACLFENGNKQIVELKNAKVPVFDGSYLFGDGIYEVISVVNGRFFDLEPHLERLEKSLKMVGIDQPMPTSQLAAELNSLLKINNVTETTSGSVYLQITRGSHFQRDFLIHAENPPGIFAYFNEQKLFAQQTENEGETSLIFPDIRWSLKHIKTTQLMGSRLAKKTAGENGAVEPIYIDKDGIITEGGSTNIFVVQGDEVLTHPEDNDILWGITRRRTLELAEHFGYKVTECKFNLDAMLGATEVFRTSTTQGIRGITQVKIIKNPPVIFGHVEKLSIWQPQEFELGNHKIGNGLVGNITSTLSKAYVQLASGKLKDKNYETGKAATA